MRGEDLLATSPGRLADAADAVTARVDETAPAVLGARGAPAMTESAMGIGLGVAQGSPVAGGIVQQVTPALAGQAERIR
ncbi:hypothetical protein ACFU8Q_30600 [Streptomyces sp. NPDC057543]|uniref:hypothetical protein n=1 Tax=Streptomyces sp. NPDC057543 TaxID=3346163 RepID=UPI00367A72DC